MTPNNNLSCLPFYKKMAEMSNKRTYAYGQVYPLYCDRTHLPPFQIRVDNTSISPTAMRLYKKDGSGGGLLNELANIHQCTFSGYTMWVYNGATLSATLSEGQYYLQIDFGSGLTLTTYTSEVFTIVQDLSPFLKIEFYDSSDFVYDGGRVVYSNNGMTYRNTFYLATELGMPEYTFNEEGEERDGFFFPTKQLSEKVYKFMVLAPEYMTDVLRLARLSEYVVITDKYGNVYNVNHLAFEVRWQPQGYLAGVEVEFRTDTVLKQIGKGY